MANRVLRDWTGSEKMHKLSAEGERFFARLIMKADDFGCYPANATLLKSHLFPLNEDLKSVEVDRWMMECHALELIILYEVAGKRYLQIVDFRQRLRQANSKYPLPIDGQLSVNGRPELKRNETEEETETETELAGADDACDLRELEPELVKKSADLTEAICNHFSVRPITKSKAYDSICDYVSTIAHRNELEIAGLALKKYMAYKARSQEKMHSASSWIGTKQEHYRDGQWIMTDWDQKERNYKQPHDRSTNQTNSTPASTVQQPGKAFGSFRRN